MDYSSANETHFVRCLKCHKILKCSRYDTTALLDHIRADHPEIEILESNAAPPTAAKTAADTGGGGVGGGGGGGGNISDAQLPPNLAELAKLARASGIPESALQALKKQALKAQSAASSKAYPDSGQNLQPALPEIKSCEADQAEDVGVCPGMPEEESEANVLYTRSFSINSPKPRTPRRRKLYRTSIERWRPGKGTIYCPKCCANKRPLIKTRTERFATNTCSAACILGCWPFCFLPCLMPNDEKEYLHCSNCKNFLGLYDRSNNCIKPNKEFVECVTEETTYKNE